MIKLRQTWVYLLGSLVCLLSALPVTTQAIEVTGATLPGDTTLQIQTGSVSYQVDVSGTGEAVFTTYPWVAYVTGADIYGNTVYLPAGSGTVTVRGEITSGGATLAATTDRISGTWVVPNDGTLHNIAGGYRLIVEIYPPGSLPVDAAGLGVNLAVPRQTSGKLNIDVLPDLAIGVPGATYQAGSYRGADIIQFNNTWVNDTTGEGTRQSRPLRSVPADYYRADLRLTTNPQFGDTNNDDFLLSRLVFAGDAPSIPDGASITREVTVAGTPLGTPDYPTRGALNPYGLLGIAGTARDYTPQPDDGFLDIGEQVTVSLEQLIPENYSGAYFVALRTTMLDEAEDASTNNNTFVSNSANKIEILETASPTLEPASAVSTETGVFVQGGNAASDFSSVSDDGNLIAFASRATNLLNLPSGSAGLATSGQQIFVKYRFSREMLLASANLAGNQANADCFNPFVSADGSYVAYDSRASNLGTAATGGRSMIYIYSVFDNSTVVVSKSATGILANGDSFRPRLSQSGRFVSFESQARNLDPARPLPSSNRSMQVYLHDRDVDGNGVFDEPGGIATYLVSINSSGAVANGWCNNAVVNLNDAEPDILAQGGMFVAYSSYARNMPLGTGYSTIYRVTVVPGTGPDRTSVVTASVNDIGAPPAAVGVDPVGAFIRPDCDEAAINGDGSQIAFTSYANNFVLNETDGTFTPTFPNNQPNNPSAPVDPLVLPAGDYNRVPDIFVRDFVAGRTSRVSVSQPRVATGTITFSTDPPTLAPGNLPITQPAPGESITINDGTTSVTLVFGTDVLIGATAFQTRDNLVNAINSSGLTIFAYASNPPSAGPPGGPGTGYIPSIYLRNTTPGGAGNRPIVTDSLGLVVAGMAGGGTQADDPPDNAFAPVQGVPFGSNQPSIDRSGRYVAFRSVATTLDVHLSTDSNNYPTSPATGELIRPLVFPTSNVYLHDRDADGDVPSFDLPGNFLTRRVSVNRFGYKTSIDFTNQQGLEATTSANSSRPAISGNARYVAFSSDSSGEGGLIFGPNNLTPLDNSNVRDVFVSDQQTVGDNPEPPDTAPTVSIFSPLDGTEVVPGSLITVTAVATPKGRKAIVSADCFVNGKSIGILTSTPFEWSFTADPAGTYTIQVFATDNAGRVGSSFVEINAKQPTVPSNPPAGSNARFVVDYFNKIFFRQPSYGEYETYLNMLNTGSTQAETIVAMMQSEGYLSAENILFGYFLRMGLTAPAANVTNVMRSYLGTMTNGTNGLLLSNNFQPVSTFPEAGTPPYGATLGQALMAETLLKLVTATGTNPAVQSMSNDQFRTWMLRSFNEPYLPAAYTGELPPMGDEVAISTNIATVPSATSSRTSRYGYNYAYMSAFYANLPPDMMGSDSLRASLTNFTPKVQGIALKYLLTPGNPWQTNTPPLSTNLAATLLPPVITNTGTNTLTVSNSFTNTVTVGGQNLLSNTVYRFVATNFPPSVTISTNGLQMVVSGRFTNTGTYPVTLIASNGPGLVGSNRIVYLVLPPAPVVSSLTVSGSVGSLLSRSLAVSNGPTNFSVAALPYGVSLNTSSGLLLGVPLQAGVLQTTLSARNAGGTTQAALTFDIRPASPMVDWLISRGLMGSDALPDADPDGDGHSNLVEFAFGMQPDSADAIPAVYQFAESGITIRYTRRIATSEVVYQVQQSPSLVVPNWTAVAGVTPQVVTPENGVTVPSGYERVSVFIARPAQAPSALFYRILATPTPAATAAQ